MVDHNDTPPVIPQPRPALQQLPTMRPTGDDVPRNIKLVDRDQIPAGPIFDLIYASHMTKDYAAENMKETLVKFERVKTSFKEKHPEVTLKINDAIAKQYTTREKKTPDSQHFEGKALDVSIRNLTQQQQDDLVFTAQDEGFTSFGFGQSILHMDYRPERSFWAYENTFRFGTKSISEWGSIVKGYGRQSNLEDRKGRATGESGTRRGREPSSQASTLSRGAEFLTSTFPGVTSGLISTALGGGTLATMGAESFVSGKGIAPLVELRSGLSQAETVTKRLQSIATVTEKYPELTQTLTSQFGVEGLNVPQTLQTLINIESEGPLQRARSILKFIESQFPGKLPTIEELNLPGGAALLLKDYDSLKAESISKLLNTDTYNIAGQTYFGGLSSPVGKNLTVDDAIAQNNQQSILAYALYGQDEQTQSKAIAALTKGQLPEGFTQPFVQTALTGSLEDIVTSENLPESIKEFAMLADPRLKDEELTSFFVDPLTDLANKQGVNLSASETEYLAFGESDEERASKLRSQITDSVLGKLMDSNPMLASIIDLFENNQGLLTLLAGGAGIAGLTGLLGGGMFGGFAAGAGGIAAARLALGPEGFAQLQNTIQGAAAPVFDMFSEFVAEGTPLGDLPVIGNILRGTVGVGRENPLAAIALASGNIGAAAGLVAGQTGIGVLDGTVNPEDLAQNLSSTFGDVTRVLDALGIAQAGGSSDGGGRAITTSEQTAQARNNYSRGNPGQSASIDELFYYQNTSRTNDLGYGGIGVQALA